MDPSPPQEIAITAMAEADSLWSGMAMYLLFEGDPVAWSRRRSPFGATVTSTAGP